MKSKLNISIKGYLQDEDEQIVLYQDVDAARYRVREFSVLITNTKRYESEIARLSGRYVGVTGKFHSASSDNWIELNLSANPHEVAEALPK